MLNSSKTALISATILSHSETALISAEINEISETSVFNADLLWDFNAGVLSSSRNIHFFQSCSMNLRRHQLLVSKICRSNSRSCEWTIFSDEKRSIRKKLCAIQGLNFKKSNQLVPKKLVGTVALFYVPKMHVQENRSSNLFVQP